MSSDLTPTGDGLDATEADDVAAEMVAMMRERHPALREIPAQDLVQALAELLPVYGAMVQARTFGHDYQRRERSAESLTKRAYGAAVLLRHAYEAEQAANAGIEPVANRNLARMLRARAASEGKR